MTVRILTGDCRALLKSLPDASVHCCVTSPPYFGLRDYGTAQWEGGDSGCKHTRIVDTDRTLRDVRNKVRDDALSVYAHPSGWTGGGRAATPSFCRCGARRIDAQMGLEKSPDEWIAGMVAVFREVRRVLRDDGTLWLNCGDSFQNKQLLMMPARLALALQADGWWLRSDIIWSKPSPMPESVTDRPTSAHEHIFLLSRSPRYYYDADAIREPHARQWDETNGGNLKVGGIRPVGADQQYAHGGDYPLPNPAGRNSRNVWTIATEAFPEAHFATFPTELAERCIKAGTSERGCCAKCGAPWVRQTARGAAVPLTPSDAGRKATWTIGDAARDPDARTDTPLPRHYRPVVSESWTASCQCGAPIEPCTVLDPFMGSGTTCLVADRLQRHAIGIELNPAYAAMARNRITRDAGLFAELAD